MELYKIEETLELTKRVHITKEVYRILHNEKLRRKKKDERISLAKLACNAIIEKYR